MIPKEYYGCHFWTWLPASASSPFCPLSSYHRTSSFCLKNSSTSIMFASVTSILVGVLECLFYNPMLDATPGTEPFLFSFWIVHCLVNKQSYQSQLLIFY